MRTLAWLGGVLALVTILSTASAEAQDQAAQARARFEAGVQLFQRNDFARALDAFRDAYRIRPHPTVLVNIANCYLNLQKPVEAAENFERYLRESGQNIEPARRTEVETALGRARTMIATIEVDAPPGTAVFVDGDQVGRTPLR